MSEQQRQLEILCNDNEAFLWEHPPSQAGSWGCRAPLGRLLWLLGILKADSIGATLQHLCLVSSLQTWLQCYGAASLRTRLAWATVEKDPALEHPG